MSVHAIQPTYNYNVPVEKKESNEEFKHLISPIMGKIRPLIEDYRSARTVDRSVVSITGPSGAGKTYFSDKLLEQLQQEGIRAAIVRFDDFLDPNPFEGAVHEIHPSFDHGKAHAFLKKMKAGEQLIEKPAWFHAKPRSYKIMETFDLRGMELLIFEGEYTLCDQATHEAFNFVGYSSVRIIIDAKSDKYIVDWDWMRDRNIDTKSFQEFEAERIVSLARYRKILEPLKSYADFILIQDSNHSYDYQKCSC